VIDVIHDADVLAQLEEVFDRGDEVRRFERANCLAAYRGLVDVELQAADAAEIVLARIEEHATEKIRGGFDALVDRPDAVAINFDERFLGRADRVLSKSTGKTRPMSSRSGKKTSTSVIRLRRTLARDRRQRLMGFEKNFAGLAD